MIAGLTGFAPAGSIVWDACALGFATCLGSAPSLRVGLSSSSFRHLEPNTCDEIIRWVLEGFPKPLANLSEVQCLHGPWFHTWERKTKTQPSSSKNFGYNWFMILLFVFATRSLAVNKWIPWVSALEAWWQRLPTPLQGFERRILWDKPSLFLQRLEIAHSILESHPLRFQYLLYKSLYQRPKRSTSAASLFWVAIGTQKVTAQLLWASNEAGQIIATSHDLTPNGGLVREIPLFQGNLGWWNIIICPEGFFDNQCNLWCFLSPRLALRLFLWCSWPQSHVLLRKLRYCQLGEGRGGPSGSGGLLFHQGADRDSSLPFLISLPT